MSGRNGSGRSGGVDYRPPPHFAHRENRRSRVVEITIACRKLTRRIYWTRPTDLFCHNLSNCGYCAHRTAAAALGERVVRSGPSSTGLGNEPRPKRRRDGEDMHDGAFRSPIRLSPTAMSSARSQPVSFVETSQDMSGEQLSRGARGQQRAGRRRNSRCRALSKSVTSFTLMSRSIERAASPVASQFRVVMRARPQRELFFPRLEVFPTGRRAVSARATSKCSLVTQKCPVCHEISSG